MSADQNRLLAGNGVLSIESDSALLKINGILFQTFVVEGHLQLQRPGSMFKSQTTAIVKKKVNMDKAYSSIQKHSCWRKEEKD